MDLAFQNLLSDCPYLVSIVPHNLSAQSGTHDPHPCASQACWLVMYGWKTSSTCGCLNACSLLNINFQRNFNLGNFFLKYKDYLRIFLFVLEKGNTLFLPCVGEWVESTTKTNAFCTPPPLHIAMHTASQRIIIFSSIV